MSQTIVRLWDDALFILSPLGWKDKHVLRLRSIGIDSHPDLR